MYMYTCIIIYASWRPLDSRLKRSKSQSIAVMSPKLSVTGMFKVESSVASKT